MARKDRTGNRKSRDQRMVKRVPEMGYYLVVTDTEATEGKQLPSEMFPATMVHELVGEIKRKVNG